jgi:hypothetical protein
MTYAYCVFGIPVFSEIPLPALVKSDGKPSSYQPIQVKMGNAQIPFKVPAKAFRPLCRYNENEFFYEMPEVVSFFVSEGSHITIQPHIKDMETVLLFFYSNALAAALYQRNMIPFHASGIVGQNGKVWLFAAPSRVGKSTTALMLHEKGYPLFTDDVVVFRFEEDRVLAFPSYPMLRIWKNTVAEQAVFAAEQIYKIRPTVEKYGIMIHENYDESPREIAGMVFLGVEGGQTKIQKLKAMDAFNHLRNNVYRSQWISGMGKQKIQFNHISELARAHSFWHATRPKNKSSYRDFALEIEQQVILTNE